MKIKPYINRRLINVGLGKESADMVFTNGRIVNVFTGEVLSGGIAVAGGRIAAAGDVSYCIGNGTDIIDAEGMWLIPGLIDPHIHPEVSKLTVTRMAEALLSRGTTTIMCSFDQIGVIAGIRGIRFAIDTANATPLKAFYCGPSRLPYTTPASTVAFNFGIEEHEQAAIWDETVGMWEYMIDSIAGLEETVLEPADRLIDAGRMLQGHLPFTSGPLLAAAAAAGAATDHESWSAEQVAEKLRAGLYVLLRHASCVDNISEGIKAVTRMGLPTRRLSLCADDTDCSDITEHGHIDYFIRSIIDAGVDPIEAIRMATLNAAEAFRVDHLVGSLAPGRIADILSIDNLESFSIQRVYADGKLVSKQGKCRIELSSPEYPQYLLNTMKYERQVSERDIYLTVPDSAEIAHVLVMNLEPSQIRTKHPADLPVAYGKVLPDAGHDILYISVTDRHSGEAVTASAFIGGFGLKRGAFATSLSPDDNNIICIGANVEDMVAAINHLFEIGGGQVVTEKGTAVADLELPVCGIMADISAEEMALREGVLRQALFERGVKIPKPFFSMLFLSITAIPEYSVTDRGLVEAKSKKIVRPVISWH